MSKRLNYYFAYKLLNVEEETLLNNLSSQTSKWSLPDPSCWMGVEVEVEQFTPNTMTTFPSKYWTYTTDDSLRNYGKEFVSIPLRGKCLVDAIFSLEKFLTTASPNHDFNRRTSVHIHVGVRYLTVEQLLNLILLYLVVEPIFFAFAEKYTGYRRQDNNFCVPISQSTLSLNLPLILSKLKSSEVEVVHELGKRWKKYTGLNLLPICTQGTIEFRHLGGTIQFETLYQWISMIQNLRGFAKTHSTEVIHNWIYSLNSSSNYIMFLTEVLGSFWSSAVPNELVQPLLEESVELTKEIISWKNKKTLLQISLQYWKDSTLATHLQDYIKSKQKNSTSGIPIAITEKYLQTLQQLTQIKEQFFFAPNSMNNTSEFLTLAHSLQLPGEVSTHTDNEVVPVSMPLILENL